MNGCDFFAKRIDIIRGSKFEIPLFFVYENGRPFSLDGLTGLEVYIPKEEGNLVLTLADTEVEIVGVPQLGQALASGSSTDSEDLLLCDDTGEGLSFSAKLIFPDGPVWFNFENLLFVKDPNPKPV
jgi:hypothetical protein